MGLTNLYLSSNFRYSDWLCPTWHICTPGGRGTKLEFCYGPNSTSVGEDNHQVRDLATPGTSQEGAEVQVIWVRGLVSTQ